jgi:nicotinate-nucleotide adenylyltransferase
LSKIVILGGSFDPIHNEHIELCEKAKLALKADFVWLMPNSTPRWKENVTNINIRLKLIELAIKNKPDYYIQKIEVNNPTTEVIYTYDTMLELVKTPNDYYYIIGTDQLEKLDRWYKIKELAKLVTFVIFERPNYKFNSSLDILRRIKYIKIDGVTNDISSSYIRENLDFSYLNSDVKDYLNTTYIYHLDLIKKSYHTKLFSHVQQVGQLAHDIALLNNLDGTSAYIAGLMHDIAKELSDEEIDDIINREYIEYAPMPKELKHQFVGEYIAKTKFHITDTNILEAIKFHTTGLVNMSKFAKIIYFADKCEPTRNYDTKPYIDLIKRDFDAGFKYLVNENHKFLLKKGIDLSYKLVKDFYKYYLER